MKARPEGPLAAAVARAVAALPSPAREEAETARPALEAYLALLLERNADVNLVSQRAAEPEALASSHLFDALFGLAFLPPAGAASRLLDLGAGAAFPPFPSSSRGGTSRGRSSIRWGRSARS